MLAKMPFRSKLILVVSVPVLALLVFAGITINNSFSDLTSQRQYGEVIGTVDALTAVSLSTNNEAVQSQAFLLEPDTYEQAMLDARAATDAAARRLRSVQGDIDGHVSTATTRAVAYAVDRLPVLRVYRAYVDKGIQLIGVIGGLSDRAFEASGDIARDLDDDTLAARSECSTRDSTP